MFDTIINAFTLSAANTGGQAPPNPIIQLFPFLILGIVMYYIFFRLPKKERLKREEMLNSVKAGDRVVTAGGIFGTVTSVKENSFMIKISDNTKVEITKNGVASIIKDDNKEIDKKKDK